MIFGLSSLDASEVRDASLPLHTKIFRLVCLATATLCLVVILPINWWQHLPILVNIGDVTLGLFGAFFFWESRRGRNWFIGYFLVLLLLLDIVWFFNAGSAGSVTFYFFAAALYPLAVLRGRMRWTMTLLLAINACGLLLVEYHYPQLIVPFARPVDRLVDLLSGVLCAGLAVVMVLWLILASYDYEHERLQTMTRDLAQSEQRLRLALEASKQSWFELDIAAQRCVIGENPARVGHPTERFQISVAEWRERLHPQDRETAMRAYDTCASSGRDVSFESRSKSDTGEWRWIRTLARGVDLDAQGKPQRIVGTLHDITQIKDLQAQLLRGQRLESVGILAGGVAHHLNNLLTPIAIGSELLRGKQTEAADRSLAEHMVSSAKRASEIVRELILFSRLKGEFRVQIDTLALLQETLDSLRPKLSPDIELSALFATDLWKISVDPVQIRQAILNLVANACGAMPLGGRLKLTAYNKELPARSDAIDATTKGGRFVEIMVSDTGRGISPENLTHIFDPFFTTKELGRGPGLGLSTAYGTVTVHGGAISVESELGRGATFRITLPAVPVDDSDAIKPIAPANFSGG